MFKLLLCPLVFILGLFSVSCSSDVDLPKGNSKGYTSARLIAQRTSQKPSANEAKVHRMIQSSIAAQFSSRGMSYNQPGAELVVAYLVVYQENGMTTYFDDYYGQSNDADAISDLAHERAAENGGRREAFKRGGIVIDVLNSTTNELVYRNFYAADMVQGGSDEARAARTNAAVNAALSPFFK